MVLGLLAGIAAGLGQAPFSLWPLALAGFFAAFSLYRAAPGAWQAALLGWAVGAGYFATSMFWIVEPFLVDIPRHGWMAPFALVGLAGGMALFWGAAFGLAHRAARWPLLALALSLTAAEMLRSTILTGFPWGLIGYLWLDTAPAQLAAVVGPHGLSLLTLVFIACLRRLYEARNLHTAVNTALFAALYPLAMLYGAASEPTAADAPRPIVRLVQPNAAQHLKWQPDMVPVFFQRQLEFTAAPPVGPPPDLVIWPETSVPYLLHRAGPALEQISRAAGGRTVIVGVQRREEYRAYNSLVVLGAGGTVEAVYDKAHLVPFGEYMPMGWLAAKLGLHGLAAQEGFGYSAGPGPQLLDLGPFGRAMPLICYEAIFPEEVNAVAERPDWLLQITNDAWFGKVAGPYQHLAQARFRAIEQGLPMVRAANTGVSAVIDARGQVIASLPLGQAGWIDAELPGALPPTLYRQWGDMPVIVLLILAALTHLGLRLRNSD